MHAASDADSLKRDDLNSSKPSVLSAMKLSSMSFSSKIMRHISRTRGTSVPGVCRSQTSAILHRSIQRGLATMILAPFLFASLILRAMTGCCSLVLEPMMKMHPASANSEMELVMAPLPKARARADTVEAWQSRAQWSTLLVCITSRANFWAR